MRIARSSKPTEPIHALYQPAFCFVAQGRKQAMLGEEVFRYDPGHYLIYTLDLPLTFQVKGSLPGKAVYRFSAESGFLHRGFSDGIRP
ncbi:MAG: AraC family transcriptional regulator [Acidobacteriota bacterium]